MVITLSDRLTARTANEGQAVPFTAKVYTDTTAPWVLVVPTTLRYRIDDLSTGLTVLDWTTVTPASSATITATGTQGTLSDCSRHKLQLTVQADVGLSTVCVATREWYVRSLAGVAA